MSGITRTCCAAFVVFAFVYSGAAAEDWPTCRHDNQRTGFTAERIDAAKLRQRWLWRSPQPPQPAWYGPAKADAYHGFGGFRSMREYDRAFGVILAANRIYFGSNTDDSVRCVDAPSGKVLWTFTAGGPVRIAPTWAGGKLYFGSDDGCAYCLDASSGKLIWKRRASSKDDRVLCNGRLISLWPVRTGVLVEGGTAYFAAGLLPWRESYVCAVDADSGEVKGEGRFIKAHPAWPRAGAAAKHKALGGKAGFTPEGAMVAGEQVLLIPQGRVGPRWFKRADGSAAGGPASSGGCFAMLTRQGHWVSAPGNRKNTLFELNAGGKPVGKYGRGIAAAAGGGYFCVLTPNRLTVYQRESGAGGAEKSPAGPGQPKWSKEVPQAYGLVMSAETIFVGCQDRVYAYRISDGGFLWPGQVEGKAYELVVDEGRLFVSTDSGAVYCFTADAKSPLLVGSVGANGATPPKPAKAVAAWGPYVSFLSKDTAEVCWGTEKLLGTKLIYGRNARFAAISVMRASSTGQVGARSHRAVMKDLRPNLEYEYYVQVAPESFAKYTLDTFFNYSLPPASKRDAPFRDDDIYGDAAEKILSDTRVRDGVCVVLGCGEGRLACQIARRSNLRVIGLETSAEAVASARKALFATGLYGVRLAVHHVESLEKLPCAGDFANLIVSEQMIRTGKCVGSAAEVVRLLQPGRGKAYLGQPAGAVGKLTAQQLRAWTAGVEKAAVASGADGTWCLLERPGLKDEGVWTHQYGTAANCGYGGEALGGVVGADQMTVQWIGRPGPRYQTDRNGRKPSPLSAGGRLFCQGQNRIVALDARNGCILWSLEIPLMQRMNVPIDCSNFCADAENVYVVVKDRCWQIDAATGDVEEMFEVRPGRDKKRRYEWGFVARCGERLLGTPVTPGATFLNYWGRRGWYDHWQVEKVCTDTLFALDPATGKHLWTYRGGMIPHSLIAAGDGKVWLIECRNEKVLEQPAGRIKLGELWQEQFAVCIDLATGRKLWESPFECPGGWANVFVLAYAEGRLIVGGVNSPRKNVAQNIVVALDAATGRRLWLQKCKGGGNHGATMSRPAVADGKVYLRPMVIDLKTGELVGRMPGGGCGTYALTEKTAIFRAGNVTMWNADANRLSYFPRLRPDCWLSTIPAAGMILSPEGGGGCTCGNWLETSAAFSPAPAEPAKQ
ncbi:MAG: outer membrane protein assembly factor BamB family protein [Planctomycetota bacterium]|jgi:outer membrane protein assembly factor BamB